MFDDFKPTSFASPSSVRALSGAAGASRARGFTLIEALVAIGAMTLVAVGIAQIFQSVGKTISAGRRLNIVNTQAALIEQQLRRDFASMTRDGFLLIRNSYADSNLTTKLNRPPVLPTLPDPGRGDDTVRVSTLDTKARLRRVDEIMFFVNGDFASAREPLDPAYVPRSKEARIYYGHGLRMTATQPTVSNGSAAPYLSPDVSDGITNPKNRLGSTGPNQYAKDWTLLRQPTLLVKPESAKQSLPPGTVFGWNPTNNSQAQVLLDKPGQIGLQPAATSIFRSLNTYRPPDQTNFVRSSMRTISTLRPQFESGLVDIATEDLGAIRSIVMSPKPLLASNEVPPDSPGKYRYPPDGVFELMPFVNPIVSPVVTHRWMDDAWPAPSDPSVQVRDSSGANVPGGLRIRYEAGPVNYVGALTATPTSTPAAAELAWLRSDQLMMSASNFLPGCTEFIVEYSFGVIDPTTQQLVWHGMKRDADLGDGAIPRAIVLPYPDFQPPVGIQRTASFTLTYTNLDGNEVSDLTYKNTSDNLVVRPTPVSRELIYSKPLADEDLSQTAHFGYLDPIQYLDATLIKDWPVGRPLPPDGRPWAWPTVVRVTLSLTDPNNPSGSEETFQFVFPTAGNPR